MSAETIKSSLVKLRESLDNAGEVDAETLALAQSLELDIQKLLDAESENPPLNSSVDVAMALETRFEQEHPRTAGIVREIINALHKMGI